MYSKKKLLELVKEENKTAKEYYKHGFHKLAAQERHHANFFKMLAARKKK